MKLLGKALLTLGIFASSMLATINLNTATKEELMSLDGIGESKAEAIIEYRKTNKFQSIDDLKNVKGIGDRTYENLKDELSTSGTTTISDTAKQKAKSKIDDSIDAKATKKTKDSAISNSEEIKQKATKKAKETKDEMIDKASGDTKQKTSKNTKENITDKAKSDTKKTIEKSKKAKDDMLEAADTEGKEVK